MKPITVTGWRRSYRRAQAMPTDGGFVVHLDGRPLKTPEGTVLRVTSGALAAAIAEEWASQGEMLDPATMPLTRLANTVVDRVADMRDSVVEAIAAYGAADLLCYRAEGPPDLIARQESTWQPLLDWMRQQYGAHFAVASGVVHVPQPVGTHECVRDALAVLDDWTLAAAASVAATVGSVVLALALVNGKLDAAGVESRAFLDEDWQSEQWGTDAEATRRRRAIAEEIKTAERFVALSRS